MSIFTATFPGHMCGYRCSELLLTNVYDISSTSFVSGFVKQENLTSIFNDHLAVSRMLELKIFF